MADRSDIIRRRFLRARQQAAPRKAAHVPSPAARQSSPSTMKAAAPQATVMQRPQAPAPQAPQPQKPQAPTPPTAPKAPKGGIEKEKKLMKLSCARRAQFLKYLLGLIILGAGGYVYLFRPVELAAVSAFISFDYITAVLVFLGAIIMLYAEAKGKGAHYYITQYRIVEEWGLLSKKQHAMQLSEIDNVKIQQSLFNRIVGIGDVEVKTSRDSMIIKNVGNPSKIESMILSGINKTA